MLVSIASCTHQKVLVNRGTDDDITCDEIREERIKMESLIRDIHDKTGISGRNVGMALLFWPGVIVNEMNASDAENLANERLSVLANLYRKHGCAKSK